MQNSSFLCTQLGSSSIELESRPVTCVRYRHAHVEPRVIQPLDPRCAASCQLDSLLLEHLFGSSAESTLNLGKKFRRNFVTGIPFDTPETATALIVLKQSPTCLLELAQPLFPCVNGIILSLCQRLSGHIVPAGHLGCMEVSVVHPT